MRHCNISHFCTCEGLEARNPARKKISQKWKNFFENVLQLFWTDSEGIVIWAESDMARAFD